MKILALSGSLQSGSANEALLGGLTRRTPPHVTFGRWGPLDRHPHFNPDLEADDHGDGRGPEPDGRCGTIAAVRDLRRAIRDADAVVIATPEYAHGMPGLLKNALDWMVGTGELYGKPVVVLSAAPSEERGGRAWAWTEETLRAQGADVRLSATVPLRRDHADDLGARVLDATLATILARLDA